MTVRQALNSGAERLRAHDCPGTDPVREAQALLGQVLGLDSSRLALEPDRSVSQEQAAAYERLLDQRLNHRPLAHLLGTAPFLDFELAVTPDTLIPRPATETLAQKMLTELAADPSGLLIDVGTGSGCLAISAARSGQAKRVIAADASGPALAVARANASRLAPPAQTVEFLEGDLLAPVTEKLAETESALLADGGNDLFIVANLPYLPDSDWSVLAPEIREFEPRSALTSGADGLSHYRRLIGQVAAWPPEARRRLRLLLELLPEQFQPLAGLVQTRLDLTAQPIANDSGTVIGLLAKRDIKLTAQQ